MCQYCRHTWDGARVEEAYGFGAGLAELRGTVIASGARNIQADANSLMSFKCSGCGAEVTINTDSAMTARCHWCRHVFGVNEQVANGAVPDAVLPFHIDKQDAVARIRQFVGKRRLFALKAFKQQFTPENVVGVYLPYMIVDGNVSASVTGVGEITTRTYTQGTEKNKKTYYDADIYAVKRQVQFTVDDLPLESSSERGNLDSRVTTNNIINTILPFDTKNAVQWNASYLSGFSSSGATAISSSYGHGWKTSCCRSRAHRWNARSAATTAVCAGSGNSSKCTVHAGCRCICRSGCIPIISLAATAVCCTTSQ